MVLSISIIQVLSSSNKNYVPQGIAIRRTMLRNARNQSLSEKKIVTRNVQINKLKVKNVRGAGRFFQVRA